MFSTYFERDVLMRVRADESGGSWLVACVRACSCGGGNGGGSVCVSVCVCVVVVVVVVVVVEEQMLKLRGRARTTDPKYFLTRSGYS